MKDYIQQLIELFGHNNYSADTHKKVQQWLADEEHVDEKSEALRELWKQAGEQKVPDGMQQSIQRMRQNLGMQSITSRRNYQLLIWRAAAILLLAVSSVSIYLMLEKERPEKDLVECYIPTAEIRELTLPDGTYVMLNSKSILLYPEKFTGETRSVYLIGKGEMMMEEQKQCCHKKKERAEKEYRDLINRLSRIEGQVRGIKRMVEEDVYCTDILIQVSAVNAALNSFNKVLLANHIRSCVAEDIREGKEETIDELVGVLQKLMK